MIAIVNKILPDKAKKKLSNYAEVVPFATKGITYPPLSGHIDIFACKVPKTLVVSPNIPETYIELLSLNDIPYELGKTDVSQTLNSVCAYNVSANENIAIHQFDRTDPVLKSKLNTCVQIFCKQGFARCSSILLNDRVITSDAGMAKILQSKQIPCLYITQDAIRLPGYKCGCFGGVCGIIENTIFLVGSLVYHSQGKMIQDYIYDAGFKLIELYDGPFIDVGSIFVLDKNNM